MTKTYIAKSADIQRAWHLVDAKGKVLGLVAGDAAKYLIGKHKPSYTPNLDCGDYVVVINAKDVAVTGSKQTDKKYYNHSGFPGGLRVESFDTVMKRNPAEIIERAVKGMLPKNKLRDGRMNRLKVFADETHSYTDKVKVGA